MLEFKNVSKNYGKKQALKDFTVSLSPGIYGVLGPNGAGKSTLMNLITDNIKRSSGEILYDGQDILKLGKKFRSVLSYMPQQQGIYDGFTATRFLYYIAALKELSKKQAKQQIEEYLNMVGLIDVAGKKLGGFSGGMKQRVMFAAAMLGNPKVLLLDEPTAGLDPEERIRIRNYISKVADDRIIIMATHVVSDIECIAKEILLLQGGRLVMAKSPSELIEEMDGKVYEKKCGYDEIETLNEKYPKGNIRQGKDGLYFRVVMDECPQEFEKTNREANLEDVYLYYFDRD